MPDRIQRARAAHRPRLDVEFGVKQRTPLWARLFLVPFVAGLIVMFVLTVVFFVYALLAGITVLSRIIWS